MKLFGKRREQLLLTVLANTEFGLGNLRLSPPAIESFREGPGEESLSDSVKM